MLKRTLVGSPVPKPPAPNLTMELYVFAAIMSFGFVAAIVFGMI